MGKNSWWGGHTLTMCLATAGLAPGLWAPFTSPQRRQCRHLPGPPGDGGRRGTGGDTQSAGERAPHFLPADSWKCSRVPWGALSCPPNPARCPTQAQDPKTPVPAPGPPKAGPSAASSTVGKVRPVVVPRHPVGRQRSLCSCLVWASVRH